MAYEAELFNVDPYYDDYDQTKKFLRMMFRPGYAVQARELTQLQTLLQSQVKRFGDHVFEDGSIVTDGQISENYLRYARVTGIAGTSDVDDFIGTDISVAGTIARVVHAEPGLTTSTADNYPVLFFEYLNGGTAFAVGNVLSATSSSNVAITATITGATSGVQLAVGEGLVVSANEGIRYVEGYFVLNSQQKIGAYELTGASGSEVRVYTTPTTRVGFDVQKSFVTADDDDSLNDPAFGYYNYAAPGSDRFKIDLSIVQYPFEPTDTSTVDNFSREDFIEFIRVVDGVTIKKEKYPDYAVLEDTLARRTYDESGHYTVDPFELTVTAKGASGDKLCYVLDPGKAYIYGYEFETQAPTKITVDRPRTTATQTNQSIVPSHGTYLKTIINTGNTAAWSSFNLNNEPEIIFSGVSSGTTAAIGKGRIRDLVYQSGGIVHAYVYGLGFIQPFSLTHATKIYLQGQNTHTGQHILAITGGTAVEYGPKTGLIFPVPIGRSVDTILDVDYAVTRSFKDLSFVHSGGTTASATINLSTSLLYGVSGHNSFPNWTTPLSFPSDSFLLIGVTGQAYSGTVTTSAGNKTATIIATNVASGFTAQAISAIEMDYDTDYYKRTKTSVTEAINITGTTAQYKYDLYSRPYLLLNGLSDVQSIISITGVSGGVTGSNLTSKFYLDGGQTDELYGWSKIYLNNGLTTSGLTGDYYDITVNRYSHAGDIGPFTVDSYSDYENIPSYTSKNTGIRYSLRDCLDFRPTLQPDGTLTGHTPPSNTDVNDDDFNYQHYLGRIDRIILNSNKQFKVVQGIPAVNPVPPEFVSEAMNLHLINLDAYTFTSGDVSTRMLENRRYTMRDIDEFGKRITDIEKWIVLHTLEHDALNTVITDDQGVITPVRGVLVDQFYGHSVGDVEDPNHNCSVDYRSGELRPPFNNRVFGVTANNSTSVNMTHTTDGIAMLNFPSTSVELSQLQKTRSTIVNPEGVVSYQGYIKANPPASVWYDEDAAPYVRNNEEGENDGWIRSERQEQGFGMHWLDWENHWFGRPGDISAHSYIFGNEDERSIPVSSGAIDFGTIRTGSSRNDVGNTEDDETVNLSIVPYMKETDIQISAYGLKPYTQMYVFFDGDNFSPTGTSALDRTYISGTTSKATANNLRTDAYGKLTGIYIKVPAGQYLTGKKNIRLSDSSSNNLNETTTAADFLFAAHGRQIRGINNLVTTRYPSIKRESVRTENIVTNLTDTSGVNSGTVGLVGLKDPLSQVFWVDQNRYPGGMFAKKISIWLSKNGENNGFIPVTLQLKPAFQDQYPHPSVVMPFGEVVKYVEDIPTDGSALEFEFSTPIWLRSGGVYAISISTNSQLVKVDTATVGEVITDANDQRATRVSNLAGFFRQVSGSRYIISFADQLRFKIHACNFSSSGNMILENKTDEYSGNFIPHNYYMKTLNRIPPTTSLSYTENSVVAGSEVSIQNGSLITPNASTSRNPATNFTDVKLVMGTSNVFSSPWVDTLRTAIAMVENEVTSVGTTAQESLSNPTSTNARYITRKVVLERGLEASNLQVRMGLCNYIDNRAGGNTCEVQVWAKLLKIPALPSEFDEYIDASLDASLYEQLTPESEPLSTNGNDFKEYVFNLRNPMADTDPAFGAFVVKIVLLSSDGRFIPKVKNLRIVAV
jgi:hypothetical protein